MRFLPLYLCALWASSAVAHEYWIEPQDFAPPADGMLVADLVNGEEFEGTRLPYLPARTVSYVVAHDGRLQPVEARIGDRPALNMQSLGDGLHVVAFQSGWSQVTYDEFAAFLRFAGHKDLIGGAEAVEAAHRARGLPEDRFTEAYARYSKSLIGAGSGEGADRRLGLETELVALDNPYTDDLTDGLRVRLYYAGEVRGREQVEIPARAPDGSVAVSTVRTDSRGVAVIPVLPGHDYMLDAVVLREPGAERVARFDAVWETLWANLTFSVPD